MELNMKYAIVGILLSLFAFGAFVATALASPSAQSCVNTCYVYAKQPLTIDLALQLGVSPENVRIDWNSDVLTIDIPTLTSYQRDVLDAFAERYGFIRQSDYARIPQQYKDAYTRTTPR